MRTIKWIVGILSVIGVAVIYSGTTYVRRSNYISLLSTQYKYSQYCLQGYRDQHSIDKLLQEFGKECDNSTEFRGNIDDPELFSLAGYRYISGTSPSSINWETQPLTKYILGLAILIFGNTQVPQYLFALATVITLYVLSRKVLSTYWSFIPPLLLMVDPLFRDQLSRSFLDLSVTLFSLLWLLYLGDTKRERLWWVGGIVLGSLSLSKSFSLGILAATIGFIYLSQTLRKGSWLSYIKAILVSIIVYMFGYTMFFVHGHSMVDFVSLHINILRLYKSYVPEYPKGEIFRIIFTGEWRTWWGDKGLVPSPFWSPMWMLGLVSALGLLITRRVRQNKYLLLHSIWIIISLGFISLRLVFPRYLLPVLPSLYFMLTYTLVSISQFVSIVTNGRKH